MRNMAMRRRRWAGGRVAEYHGGVCTGLERGPGGRSSGNVVGQVASIADAGEPAEDGRNQGGGAECFVRFSTQLKSYCA